MIIRDCEFNEKLEQPPGTSQVNLYSLENTHLCKSTVEENKRLISKLMHITSDGIRVNSLVNSVKFVYVILMLL